MKRWLITTVSVAVLAMGTGRLSAAEPLPVLELRTQKVEGTTYFHVRLQRPQDLRLPAFDTSKPFSERDRRRFARLPRLVPQDDSTRAVYYRHRPTQPWLSFCGQATGRGKARLLLLYPLAEQEPAKRPTLADLARTPGTAEAAVELDFDSARAVPVPALDPEDQHISRDDLRSLWALHQGAHFAVLETQVVDFPFYSFAREATGRKYNVVAPAWVRRQTEAPEHRLYEITSGADAVAETLQLHRLLQPEARPAAERSVHLADVPGVSVPEQPWGRMLEGEKPRVERIARLVPHDNYYVYFRSLRKLMEFGDLLDQWGTSVLRVYTMKSQDAQLRQRYERQLCLRSTALGKLLGPAVVKGVAVTGSDPYLREGTDVTVIFEVANAALFRGAVEVFLKEARREHGGRLREGCEEYHDTTIETFVTPLREVSLHRATLGDFVIYSNSPAGVRRVIDAHARGGKCLADADDFRYLRTVFALESDREEGFVFLSDAFLRQLTGPASRIKEKRRLEALTSLTMTTQAALFCAWETGKLPADLPTALAGAGLRADDVPIPATSDEPGKKGRNERGLRWDRDLHAAVSEAYNTIHFATPLVELPIERVTRAEAEEYGRFREEYAKLWRTFFDPVGLRVSLDASRVRVETHILPLAGSDQYRALRSVTGEGKLRFEPRKTALVDFQLGVGDKAENGGVVAFQVDGDALLRDIVELLIRMELDPRTDMRGQYERLFWKLPLGLSLRGPEVEGEGAEQVAGLLKMIGLVEGEPTESRYKKVKIQRLRISQKKYREFAVLLERLDQETPFLAVLSILPTREAPAALHLAVIDEALTISASEDFLKKRIDEAGGRKKPGEKQPAGEANAGLYIRPDNAREAASLFLEYEGHSLALLNNEVWGCFYRSGILSPRASEDARREAVRRFLGFIPVSPDGSSYRYEARSGEVVNARHGSLRRPDLHGQVAEASELGQLLREVKALRAELRFLDNELNTVLTIERK